MAEDGADGGRLHHRHVEGLLGELGHVVVDVGDDDADGEGAGAGGGALAVAGQDEEGVGGHGLAVQRALHEQLEGRGPVQLLHLLQPEDAAQLKRVPADSNTTGCKAVM